MAEFTVTYSRLTPTLGAVRAFAAVAAIAVGFSALSPAPTAWAEDKIGISARPADASGQADARSRYSYAADPGQRFDDFFLVTNTGSGSQSFTVVGKDAFNDEQGDFAVLATEEDATDIGTWVRFENGESRITFDLGPGESRLLPFGLELPADATPGDHVGGLVASVLTTGAEVNVDRRVATRLYARVSGDLQPRLDVSGVQAQYVGDWWNPFTGAIRMTYTATNSGNIALASNYAVGARTWFGIPAAGDTGGSIPELLPRNSHSYEVQVPGVAAWLYLNPWVTLNPFVDDTDPARLLPVPASSRDTVTIGMPWPVLILIVLVVAYFLFRWWRRKVDAKRAEVWIAYTEEQARLKAEAEREIVPAGADSNS